jgi:hypothetical protein
MFGNGSYQNNNQKVNVNTPLYTSYSDTCLLRVSAWNKMMSIKLQPIKGVTQEGMRQYADNGSPETVTTSLTQDNVIALLEGIKKNIIPLMSDASNESQFNSVSVTMGAEANRKVMTIKFDNGDIYLSLASHTDEMGKVDPKNVVTHKFNKKSYFSTYDPTNGVSNETVTYSDFINFLKVLESYRELNGVVAHSISYEKEAKANTFSRRPPQNNMNQQQYSAPVTTYTGSPDASEFPF